MYYYLITSLPHYLITSLPHYLITTTTANTFATANTSATANTFATMSPIRFPVYDLLNGDECPNHTMCDIWCIHDDTPYDVAWYDDDDDDDIEDDDQFDYLYQLDGMNKGLQRRERKARDKALYKARQDKAQAPNTRTSRKQPRRGYRKVNRQMGVL